LSYGRKTASLDKGRELFYPSEASGEGGLYPIELPGQ